MPDTDCFSARVQPACLPVQKPTQQPPHVSAVSLGALVSNNSLAFWLLKALASWTPQAGWRARRPIASVPPIVWELLHFTSDLSWEVTVYTLLQEAVVISVPGLVSAWPVADHPLEPVLI